MSHSIKSLEDLIMTDRQKIRKQWGKTDSDVEEYMEILKNWFKDQKHLPEIPNDKMIEYFLTSCKYSVEKTKQNVDMYYTIRSLIPEFFENSHPFSAEQKSVAKMGHFVLLPRLTESLHRITILKYSSDAEIFDPFKTITHQLNCFEVRLHEDLVMGEIWIVDGANGKLTHAQKLNPAFFKKVTVILEKMLSNRVKAIHVINYPPFIGMVTGAAKLFIKKKLYERMQLHPNLESLFNHVPQELLPSDYGGKEKSLQELTDLWQLKFKQYQKRFDELETFRVNEDLRPEPLSNSDILGYYGNFKKLDVD